MNIGFDAKRYFHNNTGLGNYSRSLVAGLAQGYPNNNYFLFNPKPSRQYQKEILPHVYEVLPTHFFYKKFSSLWRTRGLLKDVKRLHIDLYHGLSHEIPLGIQSTGIRSVVTIHDLIFERYPEQFGKIDVQIYRKKFRYACTQADRIIAISKQTKQDIIDHYHIEPGKIDICYQSCHPAYAHTINTDVKEQIRKTYGLPKAYFLYVGSIIERKNLLNCCKAMLQLKGKLEVPLVVIGSGKAYKQKVKEYVVQMGLQQQVMFLSDTPEARKNPDFQKTETFAAIYQMATALLYPSFFEGFGIPVLEALWSRLPVITSNTSCLPETGGDAAFYVDPNKSEAIAEAMMQVYNNADLRTAMINKGLQHAQNFTPQQCAASVMKVYQKTLKGGV